MLYKCELLLLLLLLTLSASAVGGHTSQPSGISTNAPLHKNNANVTVAAISTTITPHIKAMASTSHANSSSSRHSPVASVDLLATRYSSKRVSKVRAHVNARREKCNR